MAPALIERSHLPTNGTDESVEFTTNNNGDLPDDIDLLTSKSPGTVITVVSITGTGVSQGADPFSARVSGLSAGGNAVVTVTYSAAVAPLGSVDTLFFDARSVASPSETDLGGLELTLLRPRIVGEKSVDPSGTSAPPVPTLPVPLPSPTPETKTR